MKTTTQLMTADDLWKLPADGQRHELVKGELRTMPPAGFEHGAIGFDLGLALGNHVKANKLGRVVNADTGFLVETDPDTVRAADIAFVTQERIDSVGMTKKYFPEAPDLAVEIVSPNDRVYEVDEKVEEWLTAGTRLVWVVNPRQRTVTIHIPGENPVVLTDQDMLTGDEVLPGFQIRVGDIFP